MAYYTSRAEGLKIKEYKDYYDWNDDIRINYNPNSSNANWVFTALFEEGIWMNGILYPQNSVIASFKDGVEVNYTMMTQHKTYDEITGEVISVTNILYRVTSSITTNVETSIPIVQDISQQDEEIGEELPDEITYTIKSLPNGNHKDVEVKKYKNGTLVGTSMVTPDKITAYKVAHSQAVYKEYQVFNHLGFLWHGQNPESGYPQYSYTVMSRCDYLEVEGSQYGPHDYITTWTWDQDINLTVYDYSEPAVPYVPEDDKYPVIEVQFDTKAGSNDTVIVSKISDGVTISSKEITSEEILKSKFKGSRLRIFENFLMDFNSNASEQAFSVYSDSNYIKYNGTYVGQNKEIESWPVISNVSFKVVDETNRHTKTIKKNDSFVVHLTINGSGDQDLKKGDKIYSAVFHDHVNMYYNGHYHRAAWLAYDQPNVPGHYKTLGGLAIGWCDPYWVLITTAEGIYFGGMTYQARKLLKTWEDDDAVHLTLTQKKARKKTELNDKDSEIIRYTIITDENSNKINLVKYVNDLETTKSSFNPELVENRTFNGIAFTVSNGIINLYSKSDYVKFQNEGYKAKTFITSWAINEKANFEVYDKDFDKIQYVMDTSLSSNVMTITKEINDLVDDTVEFNPDTTANLDFHNIRFSVKNGKIYVYSKSDFIKLSGSTYKKGNQIINWPIEEKVYFAIVDESIKYEVVTSITYNVDTEQVTEVDYLIETIGDEQWKPLRVQKRVPIEDSTGRIIDYKLAGEEIINYYDCVRPPYYIYDDKLQFEFNLGYYVWYLKSASDDVYVNNEQYPAGTLIRSWNWANVERFDDIGHIEDSHKEVRLKSTTVDTKKSYETTHEYITNPTYTVETKTDDRTLILTCDQPGSSTVTHNLTWHEIHSVTWYTFYELQFNYTTETGWTMRANSNLLVVSNKLLRKGETISKWGYNDNIDMTVNVLLEDIKHTQKTDIEKALMVSTEDEWLYGYIWRRFDGPVPPPTDKSLYIVVALYKSSVGSAITSIYSNSTPLEITVNNKFSQSEPWVINTGHFNKVTIDGTTHVFWSRTSGSSPTYVVDNYGNYVNRVVYYMNDTQVSISYCVLLQNGDIVYQYDASSSETLKGKYTISYIHDVCRITITDPVVILEQSFAWLSLWTTFIVTNDGFVSIDFDGGWKNSRLTGFKYYDGNISQINNNIEALNAINAELSGSGCTVLADHFEGNTAIRFGSSIVSNCRIGKTPQTFADLDMSYFGQVIMKYDFGSNSISYYNRYSTKQLYEKVYSANNKKYLWTSGPYWTYIASTSPVTIDIGGDLKYYLYEMESVDDYLNLPAPISTQERDVNRSGLIPSVVNPTIDINRLDSDTPFKISPLTTFDILDNIPIKPGPVYSDYTDKVIIHQNGIVAVLDTVSFSQAANNFAWSLDNYGINNDYN